MKYLLDCTLRDGGYVNDWNFGYDNLISVFERLADAGTDFIEIGFLDERRPFDRNRSIMPDTRSVNEIFGELDKKQSLVLGMIDYGTCSLEKIQPCEDCFLDGIRVIFKKHLREPAMKFCAELQKLGYLVFAQLVSVTSYTDEEMLDFVRLANEVKPFAVSMVDTYGLMHQDNLMHFFRILDQNLESSISLGYHGHNNFQMGYANCMTMLSMKTERNLLVDGTICGMGKSAGNAPIELIMMHMNHHFQRKFQINQILEAMDANISQFYQPPTWGYSMFYYLAALHDCHPNYVAYLMDKRTLSISSVSEILAGLQGEKKLLYDKAYAENLYMDYQNHEINDISAYERLRQKLENPSILLIGPAKSISLEHDKIQDYIAKNQPVIIAVNYIPETIPPDYLFLSNVKRYVQVCPKLMKEHCPIIATSNVTATSRKAFDYTLNFSTLIDPDAEYIDNSLIMLLKALRRMQVPAVCLAGFDGYSVQSANYLYPQMAYDFLTGKAEYLNRYTKQKIAEFRKSMKISFLTDSFYEK